MGTMQDYDPGETQEWVDSLRAVIAHVGPERARYLLGKVRDEALRAGTMPPFLATTPYRNTIPPEQEEKSSGNREIEHKIRSAIRWNAVAIVLRANKESSELGGHIASFQSSALLYDIGFGHFWRGASDDHGGDLIYVQGHVSPGIYGRAYLEGRLTDEQLKNFRQESEGKGIPSYPHPWLMPEFWQFPTVSMGLGPLMAIYQARFLKYLEGRGLAKTEGRKVWAFLGDGECDEPESLGAISLGGREGLDNLIFVINCNLQRLDGPVRGNGKIIQELEGVFRGAGWNVIKVVWGSAWDKLFAKDKDGLLLKRMEECVDGQYQDFKSKNGAYVREHFFNTPELKALVADLNDEQVWKLSRGGHDPFKVYAAYAAAVKHQGQPTVILAKTVKGYGMGESGEGQMISHQAKNKTQDADQLMYYREDKAGQVLQEGINEAGAMSSWIAAATSYSSNNLPMIPFYIYYSMFGLQRVGDLAWLAGDMRARGFLLGGTAGRTTLNGEGLQHEDGHSHVLASTIPNCVSYDPTFAYEVIVIVRDGMRRMMEEQEDVYYYVTLMNENYPHPAMPAGAEEGIVKGVYLLQEGASAGKSGKGPRVQLMGSGTILREVIAAADLLRDDFKVNANIWSATSFNELRRDGMSAERWSLLHPSEPRRKSYLETSLEGHAGPVIAATDYMRSFADQVRSQIPRRYVVLGTDG